MAWIQLSLTVPSEQAPRIEALFEEMDALSITLGDAGDDPILEPDPGETPLWQATKLTALFGEQHNPERLRDLIGQRLGDDAARQLQIERLEDTAWERTWLDDFHPMPFGRRLWVCPTGQRPEPDAEAVILELDPGLAFGTGTHPTTALCLQWLDRIDLRGRTLIDFGCGSGILAIAALLLGAARAIATDHDPQALQSTRDNARKNHVESRLEILPPDRLSGQQADILLANILAGTLIRLEPLLASRVRPGGQIILSGILTGQATGVLEAFAPHFEMQPPVTRQEWVALEGRRRC